MYQTLELDFYSIRIFDRFGKFATSLAILCDSNSEWQPQTCVLESPASRFSFEFGRVKLLDYRDRWAELECSENVFATAVMAHLRTQETKRSPKQCTATVAEKGSFLARGHLLPA